MTADLETLRRRVEKDVEGWHTRWGADDELPGPTQDRVDLVEHIDILDQQIDKLRAAMKAAKSLLFMAMQSAFTHEARLIEKLIDDAYDSLATVDPGIAENREDLFAAAWEKYRTSDAPNTEYAAFRFAWELKNG